MPQATRLNDVDSGHDLCPPRGLATASENVFINQIRAGRVGDNYPAHSCPEHLPHTGNITRGSKTVFINSRAAGRIGDPVSCGGTVAQGSSNVWIGG